MQSTARCLFRGAGLVLGLVDLWHDTHCLSCAARAIFITCAEGNVMSSMQGATDDRLGHNCHRVEAIEMP